MKQQAVIKPLPKRDVSTLLEWVSSEGWSPGVYDIELYQTLNPQGLLGMYLEDQLIGASSVLIHNSWFAFFGLYIVHPDYREQGFGIEMTRHCLHLAGYRNIGLDGGLENVDIYRKAGFRSAHLNQRFSFSATNVSEPEGLVDLKTLPLTAILKFERDNRLFTGCREKLLQHWLYHDQFVGRAVVSEREIQGYVLLRPGVDCVRVGPLLATSAKTARTLFLSALHHGQGQRVYLDAPETNLNVPAIIDEFKGELVFETIRMYRGYQPDLQHSAIYGLAALEAG